MILFTYSWWRIWNVFTFISFVKNKSRANNCSFYAIVQAIDLILWNVGIIILLRPNISDYLPLDKNSRLDGESSLRMKIVVNEKQTK